MQCYALLCEVNAVTIHEGGSLHLQNMVIVGFSTACTQIVVVVLARLVFRVGNRRLHQAYEADGPGTRWRGWAIFGGCWAANLGAMLGSAWVVAAYGYCFGDAQTRDVFYGWGYGMGISWVLTEPLVILILASLPSLCQSEVLGKFFERMDEIGLNMEIVFG